MWQQIRLPIKYAVGESPLKEGKEVKGYVRESYTLNFINVLFSVSYIYIHALKYALIVWKSRILEKNSSHRYLYEFFRLYFLWFKKKLFAENVFQKI